MKRQEFLVFEVGGHEFAVDLGVVEEVVPSSLVTPVPDSPPFLLGLTAIRGKVVGVIDAAKRYGIGPSLNSHFLVCHVRGNLTAIAIGRPLVAGAVTVRELSAAELESLRGKTKMDAKFLKRGFELFEEENDALVSTDRQFIEVNPDLFVSTEMASRVGEL